MVQEVSYGSGEREEIDQQRRLLLGGLVAAGIVGGVGDAPAAHARAASTATFRGRSDAAVGEAIDTFVVIYADRWGPGTRIPAIVVSPHSRPGEVGHTVYDTASIARFITRRWGLETLPGLVECEKAMAAAGGPPPGDLTAALRFGA